jgi:ectoine hydroxylase-related dioxygenase (phytanoyl-CoA dioxygenase family)
MSDRTTVITHIYNEEYLLPFWLTHHKSLFDDGIIIDYNSTDNSIKICKEICPEWKIVTTRNADFGAINVDIEVMDLEKDVEGIKMVLNTTEFIFGEIPIKQLFEYNLTNPISYQMNVVSPYSPNAYDPIDNHSLFKNLLNGDFKFNGARRVRHIHNHPTGRYHTGRHDTSNASIHTDLFHVIWLGFYPLNDKLLKRKLQIQHNIPNSDRERRFGIYHFYSKEKLLLVNLENYESGITLESISPKLHQLMLSRYNDIPIYVNYPELMDSSVWGENRVLLDEDINLLQNTDFDDTGYCVLEMKNYNELLQTLVKNEIYKTTNKSIVLEEYHNVITSEEHSAIINTMPYKRDANDDIAEFSNYLENLVSSKLNEKVKIFNGDIWFRICRPTTVYTNDFNPCHRDVYLDFYRNTVNIYLPVAGSNERSSVNVHTGSHKWNETATRTTNGGAYFESTNKKYSVDAIVASTTPLNMIRPNPTTEQLMLFSPYLIHGCANNDNPDMTRFSVEVRFIRDDENGLKQEADFNQFLKTRSWR